MNTHTVTVPATRASFKRTMCQCKIEAIASALHAGIEYDKPWLDMPLGSKPEDLGRNGAVSCFDDQMYFEFFEVRGRWMVSTYGVRGNYLASSNRADKNAWLVADEIKKLLNNR